MHTPCPRLGAPGDTPAPWGPWWDPPQHRPRPPATHPGSQLSAAPLHHPQLPGERGHPRLHHHGAAPPGSAGLASPAALPGCRWRSPGGREGRAGHAAGRQSGRTGGLSSPGWAGPAGPGRAHPAPAAAALGASPAAPGGLPPPSPFPSLPPRSPLPLSSLPGPLLYPAPGSPQPSPSSPEPARPSLHPSVCPCVRPGGR